MTRSVQSWIVVAIGLASVGCSGTAPVDQLDVLVFFDSGAGPYQEDVGPDQGDFGAGPTDASGGSTDFVDEDFGTASDTLAADGPGPDVGVSPDSAVPKPGRVLWTRLFDGPVTGNDVGRATAIDSSNNVYVGGQVETAKNGADAFVRKLGGKTGQPLWVKRYTGTGTGSRTDLVDALVFDGTNIVAAGTTQVNGAGQQLWIRKYSKTGGVVWTKINGTKGYDIGRGAAVDKRGQPIIAGQRNTAWWGHKLSTSGLGIGSAMTRGSPSVAFGVAVDSSENIFIVGRFGSSGAHKAHIRKYSSSGQYQKSWTYQSMSSQQAWAVATDSTRAFIVVGEQSSSGHGTDVFIRKYSAAGALVWARTYNGPASSNDGARAVAVDSKDNVIVGGYRSVAGQGENIWVSKYSKSGKAIWSHGYSGSANSNDQAMALAVDSADAIVAVGFADIKGQGRNVWVRKYAP